jgi:hypothetical protein
MGDLQGVEQQGGAAGLDAASPERAENGGDGHLDGVRVLEDGQVESIEGGGVGVRRREPAEELAALAVTQMEVAETLLAERRRHTEGAVGVDVVAESGFLGLGHGGWLLMPLPPGFFAEILEGQELSAFGWRKILMRKGLGGKILKTGWLFLLAIYIIASIA